MPNLKLKSDVLAPHNVKTIKFSGDHTSRILKIIPPLMKNIFKITSTKFFEDSVKWDTSGDPTSFYAVWRGRDDKDARTSVWVIVKVQGDETEKDKKGNLTIYISGILVTTLPYDNAFWKVISQTYSRVFYSEQRRRYIAEARRYLEILESEIRKQLEIMGG
jgi:hypothetical protein